MASQITPEWIKTHKSMSVAMNKLDRVVVKLDKHFAGVVLAHQAKKAQDGPMRKVIKELRAESTKVSKAIKAIESKKNREDVETFQRRISEVLSGGEVLWDTDAGIMDDKKVDQYTKKAIKGWNDAAKKIKDKAVKKVISKSKTTALLEALGKTLPGVSAARQEFMGHSGKFNLAHLDLDKALGDVARETKNMAAVLKKTKIGATKMNKIRF